MADVQIHTVQIQLPETANVIIGQAHFIKTVDDLHEALADSVPGLRFGVAFCEASGMRLIRRSGNDRALIESAVSAAVQLASGHVFVVYLRAGFPVNVLNRIKALPEVCTIFCATANAVQVLVAQSQQGRGILGVIDGASPAGVEDEHDVRDRRDLLRELGYRQ